MYLENERIYLREVRLVDLSQDYCDWLNDPLVNQYLETRFEIQTEDSIKQYWEAHKDERWFAICLKSGGWHIGNIKIGPINWFHRRGEVSLVLKKEYWGKGYGSRTIKLISEYAFKVLNLNKLTAGIYDSNIGSRCAFSKAGFNREALLKSHVFCNGRYEDVLVMAKFNES